MLDFDAGKIIIVGVIALIFIPPKDLPRVLRQAGQFVGRMRRMASEFQGQFMDAMREADMADLRKEAHKLADSARVDLGLDGIDQDLRSGGSKWAKHGDAGPDEAYEDHVVAAPGEAKRLADAAAPSPDRDKADDLRETEQAPERAAPSVAHSG